MTKEGGFQVAASLKLKHGPRADIPTSAVVQVATAQGPDNALTEGG